MNNLYVCTKKIRKCKCKPLTTSTQHAKHCKTKLKATLTAGDLTLLTFFAEKGRNFTLFRMTLFSHTLILYTPNAIPGIPRTTVYQLPRVAKSSKNPP